MSAGFSVLNVLGFLGAAQALLIGAALLATAAPRTRFLGACIAILGGAMAAIGLSHTPWGVDREWLYVLEAGLSLLAGPLVYLWAELVMTGDVRPGRKTWALAALPIAWAVHVGARALSGLDLPESVVAPIELIVAYQVFFTVLTAGRVFSEPPDARAVASEVRLARATVGLLAAIHLAQLVRFSTDAPWVQEIVPVTVTVVIFSLTILAIRQSRIFVRGAGSQRSRAIPIAISGARGNEALGKLHQALEVDRVYLRPELALTDLARDLEYSRPFLSQLINERLGRTFHELLAEHRTAEARRLLGDPAWDHLTVEAVGSRAGFASRSSFYEAFKKETGVTPAAFRKRATPEAGKPPAGAAASASFRRNR